jgi:hypothetical protein
LNKFISTGEASHAGLEVKANKTKYMGVIRNLLKLIQVLNDDNHMFEEMRLCKFLGVLVTVKNEISEAIKIKIVDLWAGYYKFTKYQIMLKPA